MMPGEIPRVEIKVNGTAVPADAYDDLRSVTVQEDLDALSMFSVRLYNLNEHLAGELWSDHRLWDIGNEVEIKLGYDEGAQPVMHAEITNLEVDFTPDEPPTLMVRGFDRRHRLARGRRTRTFAQMKDSQIAAQIAREAGLRADVKDSSHALPYVIQTNQTDLEFLTRRARAIGYELFVRDKTLFFRPSAHAEPPAVTLTLGEEISAFSPRLSALAQVTETTVRGWIVQQKKVVVGRAAVGQEATMGGSLTGPRTAKRAFGVSRVAAVDEPVAGAGPADQMARGRFAVAARSFVQADVEVEGMPELKAGTVVRIAGAGKRFSGPYYITSVTHELALNEGFRTSLTVERSAA